MTIKLTEEHRRLLQISTGLIVFVVCLLLQTFAAAAEPTVPLESCHTPATNCPGESRAAPADWEKAARLACERYAPYICLPFDQPCNCVRRSRLAECRLLRRPAPEHVGSRSAYGQTEMHGLDSERGPWRLVSAFPYCSCPANAVFNAKGQCVCAPGVRYDATLRACVGQKNMANR